MTAKRYLVIGSWRQSNEPPRRTYTVGELMDLLGEYDPETPVVVSGYDGNLYNAIDSESLVQIEYDHEAGELKEVYE